ncbi:MAG TPA: alpha-amylase, partial [Bacteroidetes bacterium]|nr:alpha-amylase [Bacteroidota bacterium]
MFFGIFYIFTLQNNSLMKKILYLLIFFPAFLFSQTDSIYNDDPAQYMPLGMSHAEYHYYADTGLAEIDTMRINPPFWWTGMKNPRLQILIYDLKINDCNVSLENAKGIKVVRVTKVPNPNYLFVDIEITNEASPGFFNIILTKNDFIKKYNYELKMRSNDDERGLSNSDFIYQIMPDRFANGDYSNDSFDDMIQQGINRDKMYFRHGGDIQGIIDHFDYISDLGATAVWPTPMLENDQPYASYHGYAITDFYNIDKRFGTNELYKKMVSIGHSK